MANKKTELEAIELHPDAWKRFEGFVTAKVPNRPAAKPPASRAKSPAGRKPRKKS